MVAVAEWIVAVGDSKMRNDGVTMPCVTAADVQLPISRVALPLAMIAGVTCN